MTKTCPDCHATVLSTSQPDEALGYATRLLEHFVAEHFPHNPDWKPLPDLLGVLTQIDNAITIARDYKARLAAPPASPLRGITDEMLNAHLKATAEWVDPYEAATECGVPIECGITQDDADELNAQSRASLRVGYAAAFASPPEQPAAAGKLACRRCGGWGTIMLGNGDRETCELCHGTTIDPDQQPAADPIGQSMDEAAADNFGLTVDDLDEGDDE